MSAATLAYLLQANRDTPIYLCVQDDETKQFHRFEISPLAASRLAAECAGVVNAYIGGHNSALVRKP